MERFIKAQKIYYNDALKELRNGKKESHYMWFIFPQIRGLGSSFNAEYYGIKDLEEAREYWSNEYLRNNYLELCNVLLSLDDNNARHIFGYTDGVKLKSSLTLFYLSSNSEVIHKVLGKFYNYELDMKTISLLQK
ncbi:MAG: DUF1810 domain-containing protein [Erysipelotrichaceae bacterium]|nr:DUF1810 domain-containing protein [Erysipelotrichaceae bacterium]